MSSSLMREVAIAILYQQGKFLLQLRDEIPSIVYPGQWGLFGGHLEPEESADVAVRRELQEEIGHVPPILTKFGCYRGTGVIRHVYYGEVSVAPESLILGEGCDMGWFTPTEIHRNTCYSHQIQQVKAIGLPHHQILLDFIERQNRADATLS
ncbi:NUDIX hydrolase [Leptolyngbya sp. 'hensonii']|uniref:NUDIX hydrolase n=1 Tax=Leptolyngbya sp. 'hensonii' TaxID=1922337 RepID=UPI00094F87D3|nr:NUDIX hydrolase [Leptolyngbya sp. 'hensonii']OLP17871.1 NUDIX hydrolase [Leptolyngbya sp. 'hensonii']